jgi:hypothetical protein
LYIPNDDDADDDDDDEPSHQDNFEVTNSKYAKMQSHIVKSQEILQQALFSYDDKCSGTFLPIALALSFEV